MPLVVYCSQTEPAKTGGGDTPVLSVKKFDPAIKFFKVGKVIDIVGRGRKPDKLGWVKEGGYDQLVLLKWVEGVLSVKYLFEVNEPLDQSVSRGPPQHVVQASSNEHPHGPDLLLIVDLKGMGQVGNGAPRDGHPVYVQWVRRTNNSRVTRKVKVVQLTVRKTDIEAVICHGVVHAPRHHRQRPQCLSF